MRAEGGKEQQDDVPTEMTRLLVAMAFNKEEKEARRKRASILLDRVIGRITGTDNQHGINSSSLPLKNEQKCDEALYQGGSEHFSPDPNPTFT